MNKSVLANILDIRVCAGFLGESGQHSWWQSSFFSASSGAFLSPVFARTTFLAQYHGVREAAARVHDQHIGIGKDVFHLFRLPELVEMELHRFLQEQENVAAAARFAANENEARQFLEKYAKVADIQDGGPIRLGEAQEISGRDVWPAAAGYYLAAFQRGAKAFPYFSKAL